jgi:hypothetical protein
MRLTSRCLNLNLRLLIANEPVSSARGAMLFTEQCRQPAFYSMHRKPLLERIPSNGRFFPDE